jgi:hypothetical protein
VGLICLDSGKIFVNEKDKPVPENFHLLTLAVVKTAHLRRAAPAIRFCFYTDDIPPEYFYLSPTRLDNTVINDYQA